MGDDHLRTGALPRNTTSMDQALASPGRSSRTHLVGQLWRFRYWVVLLDDSGARLCMADGSCLREIDVLLRQHGASDDNPCNRVRALDDAGGEFIGNTPWPVVISGPDGHVFWFCARSRSRHRVVAVARGTYPGMPLPLVAPLAAHAFWKSYRCGSDW